MAESVSFSMSSSPVTKKRLGGAIHDRVSSVHISPLRLPSSFPGTHHICPACSSPPPAQHPLLSRLAHPTRPPGHRDRWRPARSSRCPVPQDRIQRTSPSYREGRHPSTSPGQMARHCLSPFSFPWIYRTVQLPDVFPWHGH